MTPGKLTNLPIYRGAKWEFLVELFAVADGVETPLDLTGLGPFVLSVKTSNGKCELFTGSAVSDYDDEGQITIGMSASQTAGLVVDSVLVTLHDAEDNPYLAGVLPVKNFK